MRSVSYVVSVVLFTVIAGWGGATRAAEYRWITVGDFAELANAVDAGYHFIQAEAGDYEFLHPLTLDDVTLLGDPSGETVFRVSANTVWNGGRMVTRCDGTDFMFLGDALIAARGDVTIEHVSFVGLVDEPHTYISTSANPDPTCGDVDESLTIRDCSFDFGFTFIGLVLGNLNSCMARCGPEVYDLVLERNEFLNGVLTVQISNNASDAPGTTVNAVLVDNDFESFYTGLYGAGSSGGSNGTVNLVSRNNRYATPGQNAFFFAGGFDALGGPGGQNGRVNFLSIDDRFEGSWGALSLTGGHRHNDTPGESPAGDSSGNSLIAVVIDPTFSNNEWDIQVYGSSTYHAGTGPADEPGWSANQIDEDTWGPGNSVQIALTGAQVEDPPGNMQIQHHADDTSRWYSPSDDIVVALPSYGNRATICGSPTLFRRTNPNLRLFADGNFFSWRCPGPTRDVTRSEPDTVELPRRLPLIRPRR